MDWLRWHHGTMTDPKWRFIAAQTGTGVGQVLAVWACMMEHASQTDPRGTLEGWRDQVYAMLLDMKPETVTAIREEMQGLVLNEGALLSWAKRQPSDATAAERMKRYRSKTPASTVTKRNVTLVTPEKRREEKKERGGARASRRCPPDWQPSEEHQALAIERGASLQSEVEKFRDHTFRDARSDWDATFRNWLRRIDAPSSNGANRHTPAVRILQPGEVFK